MDLIVVELHVTPFLRHGDVLSRIMPARLQQRALPFLTCASLAASGNTDVGEDPIHGLIDALAG